MQIKVLVISNYSDYHTTRPEAEVYINLAKMGIQISVMTFKDSVYKKEFQAAGIRVVEFHPQRRFDRSEIRTIREFIIQEKIDIIHLYNSKAIINGIKAAKGLPVKVVLYRGYAGNVHWYDPTSYFKYLHPRVDKIVCNSKGVEESIKKQLLFRKNKAITILKGHRLDWYKNYNALDLKKEFNIPETSFVIVNVANYRKMKGIEYLLKAMNYLSVDTAVYLLLVGKGMDNPKNRKIIRRGRNGDKIIFSGFRSDALNIVKACDVFVLSSVKGEGLNKAAIEAMAFCKPAIVTDIPGNRDLVDDHKNGLIVPSENPQALSKAILHLYKNRKECKVMGQNAKQHVAEKLNLELSVLQTKALYEDLCR
jgi:glycosyltransferase involved in cell wall biosynthesis